MAWRVREVEGGGSKAVIELEGVVDSTNLEDFFSFINSVLKQGKKCIVLDLENTSYISSGGISVIIDACRKAEQEGGKLVLAQASDMVRELFRLVQFDRMGELYDSIEGAIAAI